VSPLKRNLTRGYVSPLKRNLTRGDVSPFKRNLTRGGAKSRAKIVVWARRLTQVACLVLFFGLFWSAGIHEGEPSRILRLFFDINPLVVLITWLSTRSLAVWSVFALITVAATLLLGRVFCGWIWPLGTIHNIASWFRKRKRRVDTSRDNWSVWQRSKYYLLVVLLVMALFGVQWIGVFDPISLLYRVSATMLYPGAQYAVEDAANALYQSDPSIGPLKVTAVSEPTYRFFKNHVFLRDRQAFLGATLIAVFFVAIVLLNLYRPRFWCRYVCPLGALLGLCSKRPSLRIATTGECTNCGLCAMRCPAAASPDVPHQWRSTECFGCWNCVAACNQDSIDFRIQLPLTRPSDARLDLSKRALLTTGVAGMGSAILFRLDPQTQQKLYHPDLIRPPGARPERDFLKRCLKCGVCMKACPTNAVQPTLFEGGLEGVWTPTLVPRLGYCDYKCNLCGQVCPTEAIEPLPLEEKNKVKIGLASFDTTRCLPYAYGRECMVCEEHCPIPTKAIYFVPEEITLRDGAKRVVKRPRVDPERCIGCGICENVCVFKDRPAIRVTSANETRHSENRPILPRFSSPELSIPNPPQEDSPY